MHAQVLSNSRLDCWVAWLSNGEVFSEFHPMLLRPNQSPWRLLEKYCKENGLKIMRAEVYKGRNKAGLDSSGYPLVCGKAFHQVRKMGRKTEYRSYRFVRREEPRQWIWAICSEQGSWVVKTPVNTVSCPDPQEE